MSKLGAWLDYTGDECPNCGRVRVVETESGKRICERCHWCIEDARYYFDEDEDDEPQPNYFEPDWFEKNRKEICDEISAL